MTTLDHGIQNDEVDFTEEDCKRRRVTHLIYIDIVEKCPDRRWRIGLDSLRQYKAHLQRFQDVRRSAYDDYQSDNVNYTGDPLGLCVCTIPHRH